jgi:hypothetical protein
MADEYILIECPNGHTFMGRKAKTEVQELVLQQLICPTCGRRWESFSHEAIDLTGREI